MHRAAAAGQARAADDRRRDDIQLVAGREVGLALALHERQHDARRPPPAVRRAVDRRLDPADARCRRRAPPSRCRRPRTPRGPTGTASSAPGRRSASTIITSGGQPVERHAERPPAAGQLARHVEVAALGDDERRAARDAHHAERGDERRQLHGDDEHARSAARDRRRRAGPRRCCGAKRPAAPRRRGRR